MSAIVRQSISKSLSQQLLNDAEGQVNSYYIGIGKSDVYNLEDVVRSIHLFRKRYHSNRRN